MSWWRITNPANGRSVLARELKPAYATPRWWSRHPHWRAFWWGFFHPFHPRKDREARCREIVREARNGC